IAYINARPRPLALYYFGYDRQEQQRVIAHTHSGGVGINETLLHVAVCDLPFGGIGPSGMGHYHGHEGFLTFSKAKAVLRKPRLNATRVRYPPYGRTMQKLLRRLLIRGAGHSVTRCDNNNEHEHRTTRHQSPPAAALRPAGDPGAGDRRRYRQRHPDPAQW